VICLTEGNHSGADVSAADLTSGVKKAHACLVDFAGRIIYRHD
jgi:hypothetical protein